MIKKITFLESKPNIGVWHRYGIPGLGNLILATIMKRSGYDTEVCFMTEKEILEKNLSPDMIALSTMTQTAPHAYRLGSHFRQKGIPVIPVVMGGPHASFLPEEVLQHADFLNLGTGQSHSL